MLRNKEGLGGAMQAELPPHPHVIGEEMATTQPYLGFHGLKTLYLIAPRESSMPGCLAKHIFCLSIASLPEVQAGPRINRYSAEGGTVITDARASPQRHLAVIFQNFLELSFSVQWSRAMRSSTLSKLWTQAHCQLLCSLSSGEGRQMKVSDSRSFWEFNELICILNRPGVGPEQ